MVNLLQWLWLTSCENTESQTWSCLCCTVLSCWIYSCRVYGMGTTVHIEACWFPSSNHLNSQSQNLYCYQTHIWKISPFPQVHCYYLSVLTSSLSVLSNLTTSKAGKEVDKEFEWNVFKFTVGYSSHCQLHITFSISVLFVTRFQFILEIHWKQKLLNDCMVFERLKCSSA